VKQIFGILLVSCLLLGTAQARDTKLNTLMSQIGAEMTALYPLIYAQRKLTQTEIATVTSRLERMSTLFTQVGPHIKKRSTTYEISYEFIKPHLTEIIGAFKTKNTNYARSRMYGIGAICTSCHTQDTHLRTMFGGSSRNSFSSDYTYAEFNYLTRDYQKTEIFLDKHLKSDKHKTELQIIKPMQRLITIYTQIYDRPGDGAMLLRKYQDLRDHTPQTKAALKGWINGLTELAKTGVDKQKAPDFQTLETYVKKYLGKLDQPLPELFLDEDEQISRVWLRGQLYHYLNRKPKPDEIPKILYWLSICDRSIDYNFYFSLADLYLKDCIKNHSSHPYAKKCYAEYKEFVTTAYTGSGGTFLPIEVEDELFELKRMLKTAEE